MIRFLFKNFELPFCRKTQKDTKKKLGIKILFEKPVQKPADLTYLDYKYMG